MPDTSITLPSLPPAIRALTTQQSSSLNERYPTSRTTLENCVTCRGAKSFRWYVPGNRPEVATYDCPCRDQFTLSRWLWNAGIMIKYQRYGWDDIYRLDDRTSGAIGDYMANLEDFVRSGFGMVLTGPKGTGKTLLGNLVLKQIIAKGVDSYSTTFAGMIDSFADGWTDKAQSVWFNQRLRNTRMLLIDDLGREHNKGPGKVGDTMLESVLRHRVSCNLPTIITSNLSPADLAVAYGDHTQSLLSECSILVDVPGISGREEVHAREAQLIREGLTRPVVIG